MDFENFSSFNNGVYKGDSDTIHFIVTGHKLKLVISPMEVALDSFSLKWSVSSFWFSQGISRTTLSWLSITWDFLCFTVENTSFQERPQ
jgi:hypothetical protein